MAATHEIQYKGKKIKITVSMVTGGKQVGTFIIVADTDPPIRGSGADSSTAEGALENAERTAKELIDGRA